MGMDRRLLGRSRRSCKSFYFSPVVEFCHNFHLLGKGARNLIFVHSYPLHAKGQMRATGFGVLASAKFSCTFLVCKDQKCRDSNHDVFAPNVRMDSKHDGLFVNNRLQELLEGRITLACDGDCENLTPASFASPPTGHPAGGNLAQQVLRLTAREARSNFKQSFTSCGPNHAGIFLIPPPLKPPRWPAIRQAGPSGPCAGARPLVESAGAAMAASVLLTSTSVWNSSSQQEMSFC